MQEHIHWKVGEGVELPPFAKDNTAAVELVKSLAVGKGGVFDAHVAGIVRALEALRDDAVFSQSFTTNGGAYTGVSEHPTCGLSTP